jgi:uncharacterized caspase-like protein
MRFFNNPVKRLVLAFILAGLLAPAVRADRAGKPDCYYLSCGVNRYVSNQVNDLRGCAQDAETVAAFLQGQAGILFNAVHGQTLTDEQATRANILSGMSFLRTRGKAGDFVVVNYSGHGGRHGNVWFMLPHDYDPAQKGSGINDVELIRLCDQLASQGKKVIVMLDACLAGQFRIRAQHVLDRYQDPRGGGIILLLSSVPSQLSSCLVTNSLFTRAFLDGVAGGADLNHDGMITLREIRRYVDFRMRQLRPTSNFRNEQDAVIDYSLSISENMAVSIVAHAQVPQTMQSLARPGAMYSSHFVPLKP